MPSSFIEYHQPVFRPPSEAQSLILQVALGCSWNRCIFCEMYTSKKFSIRTDEEIYSDINTAASLYPQLRKVFLADGNALVLPTEKLLKILNYLRTKFSRLTRVSAYAGPKDLVTKSVDELRILREAGLKLIYVGMESGCDDLLRLINKGVTARETMDGLLRAKVAGIKSSVMIINGLGGKRFSEQHAKKSAEILNQIQPEYLSTLVLSFPLGVDHFKKRFEAEFIEENILDLLIEQKVFLSHLALDATVFRSDHASNYLILKGILNRDKDLLLNRLNLAINEPEFANLRQEWQRGL